MLQATGSVDPFLNSIDMWNKAITRAILGSHLATSEGESNGKAGPELHSIILRQLIASIRMFVIRAIEQDIVKPLVQSNYGDVGRLMPVVSLGDSDGFPPTVTEVAVLFQSGYFSEDQLQQLDRILGLPIRTTFNRVGAQNLPPALPEVTNEAQPSNKQENKPGGS